MSRQPALPTALITAARELVTQLTPDLGRTAAVIAVHLGALASHARTTRLATDTATTSGALRQVSALHPALESLADIELPHTADHAVTEFWNSHRLPGDYDAVWRSYPLGDLYQALNDDARSSRALCQTPYFVGELLVDLSYRQAAVAHPAPRVIDPACGTGHLLLESFSAASSGAARTPRNITAALDQIHGVDIDPYAVTIARYRLLTMAWAALRHHGGTELLADVPIHVAAANALLDDTEPLLARGQYQVVITNPPYITEKDPVARQAIRERYREVCSGKYSLALPFFQLSTQLLVPGGWCAQLTANSFMTREFGRRFIEQYLPQLDLRWVIDTSGAYIPGHGTPTVILVHRNQPPSSSTVATIQGKRGEPRIPLDPARGLVWSAIAGHVRDGLAVERFARRATHPQ